MGPHRRVTSDLVTSSRRRFRSGVAALLGLLAAPLQAESLSGVWLELGFVSDQVRGCEYRLNRELGQAPARLLVTVHREIEWSPKTGSVYSPEPCDLWIDLDGDGVLRANEHRRRTSDQTWCPAVGEISILLGAESTTLVVLGTGSRWSRSLPLASQPRVVRAAAPAPVVKAVEAGKSAGLSFEVADGRR